MNADRATHAPALLPRLRGFLRRRFRPRRMRLFVETFQVTPDHRIIDVGGYIPDWNDVQPQPQVLVVNLEPMDRRKGSIRKVQGDGRRLSWPDGSFDVAFSNSVIEHAGGWEDQQAFAREVARVAHGYFVQTPNRWFPIEPHTLAPFIHFLPAAWQPWLVRRLSPWAWFVRPTPEQVAAFLSCIRLLDAGEMRALFPDATIVRERFCGLTKSIIAVRKPGPGAPAVTRRAGPPAHS